MANLENNNDTKKSSEEILERQLAKKKITSWWYRIAKGMVIFLGISILLLVVVLQLPVVKNWVAQKAVAMLNEDLKTQINFESIDLNIFGNVSIKGVTVKDNKGLEFIKAKEIYADSDWFSLITNTNHINFKSLSIKDLDMKVVTYKGDSLANFNHFIALFDNGKKRDPNKPPFELDARVSVKNAKLSIVNENYKGDAGKWLDAQQLNLLIPRLKVKGPEVSAQVNNLSFITKRWGKMHFVETLSGDFSYTASFLALEDLVLNTDHTLLQGTLRFNLNEGKFRDFGNKVRWDMVLEKGSQVSGYDISYFVKGWDNDKPINLSGKMEGVLNDFTLQQFSLGSTDANIFSEKIRIAKILDKSFLVDSKSIKTDFTYQGLKEILPSFVSSKMGDVATPLGRIRYDGAVKLDPKSIQTQGKLISNIGQVDIEQLSLINYSTPEPQYKGVLELKDFNTAALTKNNQVGVMSGHFDVEGTYFNLDKMRLKTRSSISKIELLDNTIANLSLDGVLDKKRYQGIINIKDTNAKADVEGLIDFSQPKIAIDALANVDYLNLAYFTKSKEKQELRGTFDVKMAMKDLDDLSLDAHIKNTEVAFAEQKINLPDGAFKIYTTEAQKNISIDAPGVAEGKLYGQFNLADLGAMFQSGLNTVLADHTPTKHYPNQYFKFDFNVSQGLVNFISPQIKISKGLTLNGAYNGNNNMLEINAVAPYAKYIITKKDIDKANKVLTDSKINTQALSNINKDSVMIERLSLKINTTDIREQMALRVDRVAYNTQVVRDISLIGNKKDDHTLHLSAVFQHGTLGDEEEENLKQYAVNLSQTTDNNGDYVVKFEPTELKFNSFVWKVDTTPELDHSIVYRKKTGAIDVNNLMLYSDESSILVNGTYTNGKNFDINAKLTKVEIAKLAALSGGDTPMDIQGILQGNIDIKMNQDKLEPQIDLEASGLKMNGRSMGDIVLNAYKTDQANVFALDARVVASEIFGTDKLKLSGTIDNNTPSARVDLLAQFNEFDLSFAQEFVKTVFSNFRGKASGDLRISGSINDIDYQGDIALKDFGLKLNFSGVDYSFGDTTIPLTKGYAMLNNIQVKDERGTSKGSVSGAIQFSDIASMGLNLIMRADNLLLLNTTQRDFDTFWGRVYGTGDIFVDGAVTALNINANIEVLNNSTFTLNSNSATAVDEFKMLRFVEKNKNGLLTVAEKKNTGANMDIKFDISLDKGSTVNVLVGDEVGDISVRGQAEHLKFNMKRNGQMSMNGTYVVDNGTFVSKSILERTFQIAKGSYMSWDGNVMNPALSIDANYYRTVTNAGEYLNVGKLPPINIMLTTKITQSLQNPKIAFNVSAPDVSSQIKEALAFKMNNSDEKIMQFGSILALNNFNVVDAGGIDFNVGSAIASQGYNILFKQLSSVLNTISNQFQIDLNYIKGDQATNTGDRANAGVNFSVSPRISIKTGLGVPISKTQYTDANFLSGEGIIEYDWSKKNDGSRLLRVYSKPSNISNNITGQAGANQTWGAGVVYSKSFNKLFTAKTKKDSAKIKKDTILVK